MSTTATRQPNGSSALRQSSAKPSPLSSDLTPITLNKAAVAQFLLSSEDNAQAIDRIVHPAVFDDFTASGMEWMESAILFESGIHKLVDRVVVVTAPDEVRIQRVMQRDGISREKVQEWMQRQWPQERVRQQSHFEIVNDGQSDIDAQIARLLNDGTTE